VSRASYVGPLAAALCRYRHSRLALAADGVSAQAAYCLVSNLPDYAMALRPSPGARADDGVLDWLAFERGGRLALARYAWAVARDRHAALGHVRGGRARRVTLAGAAPVPVQLDGDPWGFTPATIEVLPAALGVVMV
jgi:diacylglycerol kinase family enzyme